MSREEEITEILQSEDRDLLIIKHAELLQAARLLQQQFTYERRYWYDLTLTSYNNHIVEETGLTDLVDLAIVRELVSDEYKRQLHDECSGPPGQIKFWTNIAFS